MRFLSLLVALSLGTAAHARVVMELLKPGNVAIVGESRIDGYENWIEMLSIQSYLERQLSNPAASTARQITITRMVDRASPLLLNELTAGQEPMKATIDFIRSAGSADAPSISVYYQLKLEGVYITSLSYATIGNYSYEQLKLSYDRMERTYKYREAGPSGEVAQAPQPEGESQVAAFGALSEAINPDPVTAYFDFPTLDSGATGESGLQVLTAPTLSSFPDTTGEMNRSILVPFFYSDEDTPLGDLVLTSTSLTPSVVNSSDVIITNLTSRSGNLLITPRPDTIGIADIELTVSDGTDSVSSILELAVLTDDDPPELDPIANQSVAIGEVLNLPVSISDPDTPAEDLVVTASSGNAAVVANGDIGVTGTGGTRTLSIANRSVVGEAVITVTVSDGTQSMSEGFTLFVIDPSVLGPTNIVSTPPSITVAENPANNLLVASFVAEDPTPSDSHTFSLLDSAGGRFLLNGNELRVADPSGIDYEDQTSHGVMVRARDQAGNVYDEAFIVSVTPVNEPPVPVAAVPELSALSESNRVVQGISVSDVDADSALIHLRFTVNDGVLTIDDTFPGITIVNNGSAAVSVEGKLTILNSLLQSEQGLVYRSNPNFTGLDTLGILADDRGASGAGGAQTGTTSLGIRVYRHGLDQWQHEKFPASVGNPGEEATVWGANADPEKDGIFNLLEYLLGLDPNTPDASPNWRNLIIDQEAGLVSVVVLRLQDPRVRVVVEVSDTPYSADFTDDVSEIQLRRTENLTNGFDRLTFHDANALGASRTSPRYYRLKVTYLP